MPEMQSYIDRGGVSTRITKEFYGMSEDYQYVYFKVHVKDDGSLDNFGNRFDADSTTETRETTIKYKMKIDKILTVTNMETTYE